MLLNYYYNFSRIRSHLLFRFLYSLLQCVLFFKTGLIFGNHSHQVPLLIIINQSLQKSQINDTNCTHTCLLYYFQQILYNINYYFITFIMPIYQIIIINNKLLIIQQQNIFVKMQNLLERSRRIANQNESPIKLGNLSPEKFGKGAFCDLAYTPSKLADNILYREVTTLKKIEKENGKLRETQALNSLFQDRLEQLKEERDGIQKSLNQQIQMYKRLLQQCQIKSEARIKEIQSNFKLQIQKIILQKEQQAKYAQSEKELLENRIQELQAMLAALKDKYETQGKQYDDLKNQKQKVDIMYHNSCQNLAQLESKRSIQADDARNKHQQLSRQIFTNTANHKKQLEDTINSKNKEIESLERLHRTELQKLQNKRAAENLMKNQELKDITNAFQAEGRRLNEIIGAKQKMIESTNRDLNREKQKLLELTRSYENEINNLSHEKARLLQQLDDLNRENSALSLRLNDSENLFEKQKLSLENYIRSIKDELQLNQVNYIRQKDRNCFIAGDFQKQIVTLKSQNAGLRSLSNENEILTRQVRNLRELLLESSHEMEKCKEEFIRMGKQRDILVLKLRELGYENDTLYRLKIEKEDEARGWKESYYINRSRF